MVMDWFMPAWFCIMLTCSHNEKLRALSGCRRVLAIATFSLGMTLLTINNFAVPKLIFQFAKHLINIETAIALVFIVAGNLFISWVIAQVKHKE